MSLWKQGRRRGFVLLITLLALLALTLLAHGLLALAQAQRRGGGVAWLARARILTASSLADQAARSLDSLPALSETSRTVTWPGGHGIVTLRRLSEEVLLLEARVDSADHGEAAAGLLWAASPAARVASLPRAAYVAEWPDIATLERIVGHQGPVPDQCPPDTVPVGALRPLVALLPAELSPEPGHAPALGLLDHEELRRRLSALPGLVGTPAPRAQDGACVPDPWNWGDPDGLPATCADRYVAGRADGDLVLQGGVGQGVVVTGGSLTLQGTRFAGLLLVGGDLDLMGGAEVQGAVSVAGAVRISGDSRLVGRPCSAFAALASAEGAALLRRPMVLPVPGWVLP